MEDGDSSGAAPTPDTFLSLVLPAYNEAKRIGDTLQKTQDYLDTLNCTWEIVVVDDGSADNTAKFARKAVENKENITVIRNDPNRGKGHALKTGMCAAKGQYIGFMDADNKTDITCTAEALKYLEQGLDVVIGSRKMLDSQIHHQPKLYRRLASQIFNRGLSLVISDLGRYKDTQCGFKFFTQKAAHDIFSRLIVERFMFDAEVLFLANRLQYQVHEMPVRWASDHDTRTTFVEGVVRNTYDLFRIRKAHRNL